MKHLAFPLFLLAFFVACRKEAATIEPPGPQPDEFNLKVEKHLAIGRTPPNFKVVLPAYLKGFYPTVQPNDAIAQLGRVIFFDKKLSKDGTVACANCHLPQHGFSDPSNVSTGIFGRQTSRNSMALANNPWFGATLGIDSAGKALLPLFWDSRAVSVAEQSRGAFENENEMGMTIPEVLQVIENQDYYPWLFRAAFGDTLVDEPRLFTALNHFMLGMGARRTKFDIGIRDDAGQSQIDPNLNLDFPNFTPEENAGKALFIEHCESCHGSLLGPPRVFEANNGLENPYIDKGKGAVSGLFYEIGTFKTPGLRNVEISAPYMHDGRFKTLDEVIEHYDSGVKRVFGLHGDLLAFDQATQTYSAKRLNLSQAQKAALKAFLLTLTDSDIAAGVRFGNPFR